MTFISLGLMDELTKAVEAKGYQNPSPIQIQAIPLILSGRDVLAAAQTGTGKTGGFTLPLLQRLMDRYGKGQQAVVRALILTPTRELAAQVRESVKDYGKHLPLKSAVIFGGVGFNPQAALLRRGVDVLVATPGRLLDHLNQGTVDLGDLEILVLDEADRMLDMGFIHDIKKIIAKLPKGGAGGRQTLLFSATFSPEIRKLAEALLNNPVQIDIAKRNSAVPTVTQVIHPVDRSRKKELLSHLILSKGWSPVLVFTRTKHSANRLAQQLAKDGFSSAAIHGNKSQSARTKALSDFKKGDLRVLVATDIAARGLDIDELPFVVNFELPNIPEDYVHRIGRTGRAGKGGEAISLVCVDELSFLNSIEAFIKTKIPREMIDGFSPDPRIAAESVFKNRPRPSPRHRPGGRNTAGKPFQKPR